MNLAAMVRNLAQLIATRRFAHRKFASQVRGCSTLSAMKNHLVRLLIAGPIDRESLLVPLLRQLSRAVDAARPSRSFPRNKPVSSSPDSIRLTGGRLKLTALGLDLAIVIDLYSRKVVGWSMGRRLSSTLVWDALQIALWRRRPPKGHLSGGFRQARSLSLWSRHQYRPVSSFVA